LTPYAGEIAPPTDDLIIALSRLTTALGEAQTRADAGLANIEPRDKQLVAPTSTRVKARTRENATP